MNVVTVLLLANWVGSICSNVITTIPTSDVFSGKFSESSNAFRTTLQGLSPPKNLMNYNAKVNYVNTQDSKIGELTCKGNCSVPNTIISKKNSSKNEDPVLVSVSRGAILRMVGLNSRSKRLATHHSSLRKSTDQDVAGPQCPRTDDGKCARAVQENSRKVASIFLFPERKRRGMMQVDESVLRPRSVETRNTPFSSISDVGSVECSRNNDGKCMKVVTTDKPNGMVVSAENDLGSSSKPFNDDELQMLMKTYILLILRKEHIQKEYCGRVHSGEHNLIGKCSRIFKLLNNKNIKKFRNSLFSGTLQFLQSRAHVLDNVIAKKLKSIFSFDMCQIKNGGASMNFNGGNTDESRITKIKRILQRLIDCPVGRSGNSVLSARNPDPQHHMSRSDNDMFIVKRRAKNSDATDPIYPSENQVQCVDPETGERVLDHMCVNSNENSAKSSPSSFDPNGMEHTIENDLGSENNRDYGNVFHYKPFWYTYHKFNHLDKNVPLRKKSRKSFSNVKEAGKENIGTSLTRGNGFNEHGMTKSSGQVPSDTNESFPTRSKQQVVPSYVSKQLLPTMNHLLNDKIYFNTEKHTMSTYDEGISRNRNGEEKADVVLKPSDHWQEVPTHTKTVRSLRQRMRASVDPYVTKRFRSKGIENKVMDFLKIEKTSLIAPENSLRQVWTFRGRVSDSSQSEFGTSSTGYSDNTSGKGNSDASDIAEKFDRKLFLSKNQLNSDESSFRIIQESSNKIPVTNDYDNQSYDNKIETGDTSVIAQNPVINFTAKHSKESGPFLQNFVSGEHIYSGVTSAPVRCSSGEKCSYNPKRETVNNKDKSMTMRYHHRTPSPRRNNAKIYRDNQNAQARRIANHTLFDSDSDSETSEKKHTRKPLVISLPSLARFRYPIGSDKNNASNTTRKPCVSNNCNKPSAIRSNKPRPRSLRTIPLSQKILSSKSGTAENISTESQELLQNNSVLVFGDAGENDSLSPLLNRTQSNYSRVEDIETVATKNGARNNENSFGENVPFFMDMDVERDKNDNSPPINKIPIRTHSTDLLLESQEY